MAGPHVVGVVALLWSARPQLVRDIAATKTILQNTANPGVTVTAQTCGGTPSTQIPNNSFGYGRVDAWPPSTPRRHQHPPDADDPTLTPTPTPNPVPGLTSLSPSSKTVGAAGFTLTVNGSNFVNGATVSWNNSARVTTFVSSVRVTAQIPATDLVNAGTVPVIVTNPGPGGGASNSLTFTINNPKPTVTSISPASATAGGPAFTLTVNGSGFVTTSVVNWNGAPRTTTFSSSTTLTAAISAADIATGGTINVTVTNPGPGGGTSPEDVYRQQPSARD